MIAIAGATGRLGTQLVRLLTARGLGVRTLTRDPTRAGHLEGPLVEVMQADVRDPQSLERALAGADTVISAVHGFNGTDGNSPQTVDDEGNRHLIHAARAAGAAHVVLISVHGAAPDHPMELMRMKYRAEQELRSSGLPWTIVRPTAYMETWAMLIGEPLVKKGKTRIFGRGTNPINFVSVVDVARFTELAVVDPALRGVVLEVGGPANLTFQEVVETFATVTGIPNRTDHVPLAAMRVMARAMRPFNATLAGQIRAGVVMDTHDMRFDPADLRRRFPSIALTPMAAAVERDYGAGATGEIGDMPAPGHPA